MWMLARGALCRLAMSLLHIVGVRAVASFTWMLSPCPLRPSAPLAAPCSDEVAQPLPVAAAANEAFKAARAAGKADADFSAVHEVALAGPHRHGGG